MHPNLGVINSNFNLRRGGVEFPKLAWFTRNVETPKCLILNTIAFVDKETGKTVELPTSSLAGNGIALNRIAIGFSISEHGLTPWPDYYGYETREGQELNESARAVGDNPDEWLVSERPVDVATAVEARVSRSVFQPKLERSDAYLRDIKKMVALCRDRKDVFIPPAWLSEEKAKLLAAKMGIPIGSYGGEFK